MNAFVQNQTWFYHARDFNLYQTLIQQSSPNKRTRALLTKTALFLHILQSASPMLGITLLILHKFPPKKFVLKGDRGNWILLLACHKIRVLSLSILYVLHKYEFLVIKSYLLLLFIMAQICIYLFISTKQRLLLTHIYELCIINKETYIF